MRIAHCHHQKILIQKKDRSLRGKSGKKTGSQSGHKGSTLKKVENPDKIISHLLTGQCNCGIKLSTLPSSLHSTRQVFEVEIKNVVVEHQVFEMECSCGMKHCSAYPDGVDASVQYGPGVRAIVGHLSKYQLIPSERLEEMMSDIFNTTLFGKVRRPIAFRNSCMKCTIRLKK